MHEEESVFMVFEPKGRRASKCSGVLLMFILSATSFTRNYALGLCNEKLLSLCCFLPIEDVGSPPPPRAICLSTFPTSRNNQQNHLRCSHSSCYPSKPNNDKLEKAGWVSHWCIYQGRKSSNRRAQSNRHTGAEEYRLGFSLRTEAFKRRWKIWREFEKKLKFVAKKGIKNSLSYFLAWLREESFQLRPLMTKDKYIYIFFKLHR